MIINQQKVTDACKFCYVQFEKSNNNAYFEN